MKNIKIIKTRADNGECDLGCWNEGHGVKIIIDGDQVFDQQAWASCCDNSEISNEEIFRELLKALKYCNEVVIDFDYMDDSETETVTYQNILNVLKIEAVVTVVREEEEDDYYPDDDE